jgi:hypothetical protein
VSVSHLSCRRSALKTSARIFFVIASPKMILQFMMKESVWNVEKTREKKKKLVIEFSSQ